MEYDERVRAAVANNAEWCDLVCRAHGMPGRSRERAWSNSRRTPQFYPDAITLAPDTPAAEVLEGVDESPGCSVKDSYATLDLTDAGYNVLFEAQWIHRPPTRTPIVVPGWQVVGDVAALRAWEQAWHSGDGPDGTFLPELLETKAIQFLGRREGDRFVAGAVAYCSGPVVGISNLFTQDDDPDETWTGALAAIARTWPDLPVVGYERDEDLETAIRQGFTPIGPLRIWLRS